MEPPFDCDGKITPTAMIKIQANHKALVFAGEASDKFDGRIFEITDYVKRDIKSFAIPAGA